VKKFRLPYESDPVGTRCPASGLGFRLRTRGSATLPLIFSQLQGEDPLLISPLCASQGGERISLPQEAASSRLMSSGRMPLPLLCGTASLRLRRCFE